MALKYSSILSELTDTLPFIGPEAQERHRGKKFVARLGANENVFGPSPKAIAAIQNSSTEIWKYGDPENYALRSAIAEHHKIPIENIVVGEGIDGLLLNIIQCIAEKNSVCVTSLGSYPTFNYHVRGFGGKLLEVPYSGNFEDLLSLNSVAERTDASIIYVSNPNNPMGTFNSASAIEAMIWGLPQNALLLLDEAYIDFLSPNLRPYIPFDHPQVVRLRTFSKAYGLAGARVGYAIAEKTLISSVNKIRNHFGVNLIAQEAAIAALSDQSYLTKIIELTKRARSQIYEFCATCGLQAIESQTNFVTIDCGSGRDYAQNILELMGQKGYFLRMPTVSPHDRCIRVTVSTETELGNFFQNFLSAASKATK